MYQTRILMGMPITVEIVNDFATGKILNKIFSYFTYIDEKFSTYKKTSEISQINNGKLNKENYSKDMKTVLNLSEETKSETNGYFDIYHNGKIDPSGLVKGWAIYNASKILRKEGYNNFYIEAGGDIQSCGKNKKGQNWIVGIRNPFNIKQIVKVISIGSLGVATSGNYERGEHVYNPKGKNQKSSEIVSLTVIGKNIYEADRFATAAFAMQKRGVVFIEKLKGFEGYMIDTNGQATLTSGFEKFIKN